MAKQLAKRECNSTVGSVLSAIEQLSQMVPQNSIAEIEARDAFEGIESVALYQAQDHGRSTYFMVLA